MTWENDTSPGRRSALWSDRDRRDGPPKDGGEGVSGEDVESPHSNPQTSPETTDYLSVGN